MADFPNLYEWIQTVKPEDFPPAPYQLYPGITVVNWDKFIKGIQLDGPENARALTGALQCDLRELYDIWRKSSSDPTNQEP